MKSKIGEGHHMAISGKVGSCILASIAAAEIAGGTTGSEWPRGKSHLKSGDLR